MTGLSDYAAKNLLNYIGGQVVEPALPALYLALFTAVGTDAGTGFTEVSAGGYTRQQIAGTSTTSATTASGNNTLHFTSVPAWVTAGMSVSDETGAVIPASTTVVSVTSTTVVMSANATGGGVGNGDTIVFSAFTPASGSGPSTMTTGSIITMPTASANWGTSIAWGVYDASSAGDLLFWDYMGTFSWLPFTNSSASPGVITAHAHGFSAADNVIVNFEYGGVTPTFSQSNFTGTLAVVSPTTDTFTVTNGGTAVNTSSTGNGMIRKIQPQAIASGVTASFAAGSLTVTSA